MNTGPLDTAPIVDRVRDQVVAYNTVGATSDIAQAQSSQAPAPCAYVVLGAEQGGQRLGASGAYRQRASATVGVLIGVRVFGDETGGDAAPELRELIAATRGALLGWRHPDAETVFEFADGRVIAMDSDSTVWWLERYRCDYWLHN